MSGSPRRLVPRYVTGIDYYTPNFAQPSLLYSFGKRGQMVVVDTSRDCLPIKRQLPNSAVFLFGTIFGWLSAMVVVFLSGVI